MIIVLRRFIIAFIGCSTPSSCKRQTDTHISLI